MQHLEGSGTPVLYIGRTVLKSLKDVELYLHSPPHLHGEMLN